jgi:phosphate starvation-inducible protein PhoH
MVERGKLKGRNVENDFVLVDESQMSDFLDHSR